MQARALQSTLKPHHSRRHIGVPVRRSSSVRSLRLHVRASAAPAKESLLQALLQRAEAQQSGNGSAIDTSASDKILNRLPGKDELTSVAASLMNSKEGLESALSGLTSGPGAAASSLQGLLQGGDVGAATGAQLQGVVDFVAQLFSADQIQELSNSLQGTASMPSLPSLPGLPDVQAATSAMQSQLDGVIQVVGAAFQLPGVSSTSSSALLESRRAAGHLLDLTPLYKAWAQMIQPLEIFGDRWLLNILFVSVFTLVGFTLLAKTPRN